MSRRLLTVVGLLVGWNVYNTHQYARLWVHPLPVWSHAARIAPLKPRPWMNVAVSMVMIGNLDAADRAINIAEAAATQPHTPPWDRQATTELVTKNRVEMLGIRRKIRAVSH